MKISVVIPTYNSAAFIQQTLDAVLAQTRAPDEVLILDDGSTDDTLRLVKFYQPRVTVLTQPNAGVAAARNALCHHAKGDLIAFLDHDDLWHPKYLEVQSQNFAAYPAAMAFFTEHLVFSGYERFFWKEIQVSPQPPAEVIAPEDFLRRYNESTGQFYSMSFCCLSRGLLNRLGEKLFYEAIPGVDDCYLCNLIPLHGAVVLSPQTLVAYRGTPQGQSANKLSSFRKAVEVFGVLEKFYSDAGDGVLREIFLRAFGGKQRRYGKALMADGQAAAAREQFKRAMATPPDSASKMKAAALLLGSYFPAPLQPAWHSSVAPFEPKPIPAR